VHGYGDAMTDSPEKPAKKPRKAAEKAAPAVLMPLRRRVLRWAGRIAAGIAMQKFNVLVLWRFVGFMDVDPKARFKMLWLHDVPNNPDFTKEYKSIVRPNSPVMGGKDELISIMQDTYTIVKNEDCDNNRDDNGDQKVDCADDQCIAYAPCLSTKYELP
jgi:hypothetical protein